MFFSLLLPKDRTALFLVPLGTLLLGASVARSRFGHALEKVQVATLLVASVYFIGCLRLTYFKEWKFNADVQEAFQVLRSLQQRQPVSGVHASWHYVPALNFYRAYYKADWLPEFKKPAHIPEGKDVYIFYAENDEGYAGARSMKVIYRGARSELIIAIPGTQAPAAVPPSP